MSYGPERRAQESAPRPLGPVGKSRPRGSPFALRRVPAGVPAPSVRGPRVKAPRAVEARDRWTAADCLAELEALARRPFHRPVDTDDDVSSN